MASPGYSDVSAQVRNAQHLAGIDLVRVGQHGLVGLEDHRMLGARLVEVLGDLPEVVALLDGVEHRLLGVGNHDLGFDRGDAVGVADGDDGLLDDLLALNVAADDRLVALHLDAQLLGAKAVRDQLLLQRLGAGGLVLAADANRLAGRLYEIKNADFLSPCL